MANRAVFLDRDGTLIHPRHYPTHPNMIQLFDGVAEQLNALQGAGWRLVVITNQSGLAHGYFDGATLQRMHGHLRAQLHAHDVTLDAIYICPHHPDGTVPEFTIDCDCRKPRPGMLVQAADELGLDLGLSWFIGDILDDVEAGKRAGCRTVLVDLGTEARPGLSHRQPDYVARNTVHALGIVRSIERLGPQVEETYCPEHWSDNLAPSLQVQNEVSHAWRG